MRGCCGVGVQTECMCSQSAPTLCDPMDCTHQAPLSKGFSRQEYWSGLPFPSAGNVPDPGMEPMSLASAGRFTIKPPEKPVQAEKRLH